MAELATDRQIRLSPSGKTVAVESGDTVLSALERVGYALPNNCRAGACGECKTRVLCGEFDQGMVLSMALSRADRDEGWGLMCMATPISAELEIEFGTEDAKPLLFPPRTDVPFVVVDRIERTPSIAEFRLRPRGDALRYWPGQYVQLSRPGGGGAGSNGSAKRCYSIANAPRPDGEVTLLVTRVEGGATSGWLHDDVRAGDTVMLDGPFGTFLGDPATETPVVCLASGSGLAPILALADAALRRGFPHPVTLVFSARSEADVLDPGLFAWWSAVHPNFRAIVTYTGDAPPDGERTGRVPAILGELFESLAETSVFIAGNPDFVDETEAAARALGAADPLVHTEGFTAQ